ncbi:MAG: glycogen-binding domain-containing protein [bacterium]
MDHPTRRPPHPRRRLRVDQRDHRRPLNHRHPTPRLAPLAPLLALLLAPAPARAQAPVTVEPRVILRAAWVDNPFYDPLDPRVALAIPATAGDTARLDLRPGLAIDAPLGARTRLIGDLDALYTRYAGAADTHAWEAALDLAARHPLTPALDASLGLRAAASHVDLYARDDLRWGEARLALHLDLDPLHLDATAGLGLRDLPDRAVYAADGTEATPGQRDLTARARLTARTTTPDHRTRLGAGLGLDLVRTLRGGLDHETPLADAWIAHALGDLDLALSAAGWLRRFAATDLTAARLDRALALEARAGWRLLPGLELAARYRYIRSGSDAELGRYAQHYAGLELIAWHAFGDAPPPRATPAGATPLLTPAGWRFRHHAPGAARVALAGDFNRWSADSHPLTGPDPDGWWTLTLPLPPGRHGYMLVIDGDFTRPADAPAYADDGFGGEVGVLYVLPDMTSESAYRPEADDR